MSAKVSFEGIGEVMATFYADEGVKAGQTVKVSASATVGPCSAGERFCGVAASVNDGCAAVQVAGLTSLPCGDSAVTVGYVTLTADGNGGVKKAGSGDGGTELLVVSVDGGAAVVLL